MKPIPKPKPFVLRKTEEQPLIYPDWMRIDENGNIIIDYERMPKINILQNPFIPQPYGVQPPMPQLDQPINPYTPYNPNPLIHQPIQPYGQPDWTYRPNGTGQPTWIVNPDWNYSNVSVSSGIAVANHGYASSSSGYYQEELQYSTGN